MLISWFLLHTIFMFTTQHFMICIHHLIFLCVIDFIIITRWFIVATVIIQIEIIIWISSQYLECCCFMILLNFDIKILWIIWWSYLDILIVPVFLWCLLTGLWGSYNCHLLLLTKGWCVHIFIFKTNLCVLLVLFDFHLVWLLINLATRIFLSTTLLCHRDFFTFTLNIAT